MWKTFSHLTETFFTQKAADYHYIIHKNWTWTWSWHINDVKLTDDLTNFFAAETTGIFLHLFLHLANWRKLAINLCWVWQSKKIIKNFLKLILRMFLLTSFLKIKTAFWSKEKTSANFSRFRTLPIFLLPNIPLHCLSWILIS